MSDQKTPYSSPPDRSAGSDTAFGTSSGSGSGLSGDLRSATDTARSDLRSATSTASSDFGSLKDQAASDLSNLTSQAGNDLSTLKNQAADQLQTLKAQAQEQLGEVTEKAKSYATEQVSQLTDRARSFADETKGSAAQQLKGVVDVADRIAQDLRDHEQGRAVAPYADSIVNGLRQLADTVENRSVDDLLGTVRDFGRRQPAAFLTVAAIAGFAASRFLMASARRASERASEYESGGARYGAGSEFGSAGMGGSTRPTSGMGGATGVGGSASGSTSGMGGSEFGTAGSTLGAAGATEFGGAGTLDVAVDDDRQSSAGRSSTGQSSSGASDNGRL